MSAMTETTTAEQFDESIQEELEQLSYWSHGDHVEIEITEVRQNKANDDKVKVTFNPPAGDTFTEDMVVPKDPSHETEFTALLRTVGRNYDTAEGIIGERVPANYTDDGWEIDYEEPEKTARERVSDRFDLLSLAFGCSFATTVLLFPIAFPLAVVFMNKRDDFESWPAADAAFAWVFFGGLYVLIPLIILSPGQ